MPCARVCPSFGAYHPIMPSLQVFMPRRSCLTRSSLRAPRRGLVVFQEGTPLNSRPCDPPQKIASLHPPPEPCRASFRRNSNGRPWPSIPTPRLFRAFIAIIFRPYSSSIARAGALYARASPSAGGWPKPQACSADGDNSRKGAPIDPPGLSID